MLYIRTTEVNLTGPGQQGCVSGAVALGSTQLWETGDR